MGSWGRPSLRSKDVDDDDGESKEMDNILKRVGLQGHRPGINWWFACQLSLLPRLVQSIESNRNHSLAENTTSVGQGQTLTSLSAPTVTSENIMLYMLSMWRLSQAAEDLEA